MTNSTAVTVQPLPVNQPSCSSFWQILRFCKSWFVMTFWEDSLETVGKLADVLSEMPAHTAAANYLKQDSDCAQLIQERYIPPAYDLDYLLTLAPDTLGHQFASAMKKTGFDPNLHEGLTAETDGKYVELRLSQTHDIWHVITGFDVSEMGEIGLQAFHLTQFPYPLAMSILASSFIASIIWEPKALPDLIEAIARGLTMGKAAKQLFAQKWEEGWDKPLAQWQADLNVKPIQSH